MIKQLLFPVLALALALPALADQECLPSLYIASGGAWYARCIPEGTFKNREAGKTQIYLASSQGDTLEHTFDWYSPKLFITGAGGGFSVVRLGPWPVGGQASDADLAIGFYRNGKLLKRYSTLDLAGSPSNVQRSVSHYTVIKEIVGFVNIYRKSGNDILTNQPGYGFEITLNDDSRWVFDLETGNRVPLSESMFTKRAPAL